MGLTLGKTLTTDENNPVILQQQVESEFQKLTKANKRRRAIAISEPEDPIPSKIQQSKVQNLVKYQIT